MNDTSHNMHLASKVLHLGLNFDILFSTIVTSLSYQLPAEYLCSHFSTFPSSCFLGLFGDRQGDRQCEHCSHSAQKAPPFLQLLFFQRQDSFFGKKKIPTLELASKKKL